MPRPALPTNPFALVPERPVAIAGQRLAEVFGAPVEIVALPARGQRRGIPMSSRAALQDNRAPDIIAREAVWESPGVAMSGNAFPFTARQVVLWATEPRRDPSLQMLEVAYELEDLVGGTTIVNSMGAAGSITRSHIHLLGQRNDFFSGLPQTRITPRVACLEPELLGACEVLRLGLPFPGVAVGLRGTPADRARAMFHLLESRTTPAFNLIGSGGIAWLVPRSAIETPGPYYPQALGGAEIWGRWCCNDEATFARLTGPDMENALRIGCVGW
jgi:hypothetical protein